MVDETQIPEQDTPVEAQNEPVEAQDAPPAGLAEPEYTPAQWREIARATFGCSPHAVAGALAGESEDQALTESYVRVKLDRFSASEGV